jgi:hypothetical protein
MLLFAMLSVKLRMEQRTMIGDSRIPLIHFISRTAASLFVMLAACLLWTAAWATPEQTTVKTTGQESCCGGTGIKWHFTRSMNGIVIDDDWLIPTQGRWTYTATPSKDGGMLFLGAIISPIKEGEHGPTYEEGVRYYHCTIPGLGMIVAKEHEPGEVWTFDYNGYVVEDSEGYVFGDLFQCQARTQLDGRWDELWDGVEISTGVWAEVNCTGQTDYLCSSSGMTWAEVPEELQGLKFVEVDLKGLGHFYGRCHEVGEVWTVTVGDKVFQAVVTEKDPAAHPIDTPKENPKG